ncbi:MAG: FtsX-like permease family protein [Propionibacteriaceae bacterium]|nr:FtsX-like permease family protein [Propionibacteriaceae bacterium]
MARSPQASRKLFWRMLLASLLRRRSRAFIAALAIGVGATTLTALASISFDLDAQLSRQLRSYGANLVVTAETGRLSAAELPSLDAALGGVELAGQSTYRYEIVQVRQQGIPVVAIDPLTVLSARPYWSVSGALPQGAQVLVGRDIAEAMQLSPGAAMTLTAMDSPAEPTPTPQSPAPSTVAPAPANEVRVQVVGTLSTGGAEDSQLVITQTLAAELFGDPGAIDLVEYSVVAGTEDLAIIAERAAAAVDGSQAEPVKRLASAEAKVQSTLNSMLAVVSVVVLALTAITVATTMLALVAERQTEIALKKALGATNGSVRREFLTEGLLLGIIGGVLGMLAGVGLAAAVSFQVFGRALTISWPLLPAAVLGSVLVAVAAGYPPVRRAASVSPAIVLRGE